MLWRLGRERRNRGDGGETRNAAHSAVDAACSLSGLGLRLGWVRFASMHVMVLQQVRTKRCTMAHRRDACCGDCRAGGMEGLW